MKITVLAISVALASSVSSATLHAHIINGDFEDLTEPFPFGWETVGGDWIAVTHPGLTGEGTAALLHDPDRPPGGGPRIRQEVEQTGPHWQLEFLYAAAQPFDATGRTINMLIVSAGPHINLRTDYEGNLDAFDGSQWQTIIPNLIEFSVDTNADGSFAAPGDVLNVHKIRIVGDYRDSPQFDVYATAANSDEFVHISEGNAFYASGTPAAGAGIDRLDIRSWGVPFVVDEIELVTIPEPDPLGSVLVNGDFEDLTEPFPAGWATIDGDWIAVPHPGLTGEGTAALLHDPDRPAGSGPRISQAFGPTGPHWQLEFLYAGAQPPDVGGRTINMLIRSGAPHIALRTDYEGNLQAFDGSQWQTIIPNLIEFSADVNGDGSFAAPGDVLNVHQIRVIGDYRGSPQFDVYATAANGDEFVHVSEGNAFFFPAPATGAGIDTLQIRSWGVPFVVDEIELFTISEPIEIVDISPPPGTAFHDSAEGLSFAARSADPIDPSAIRLILNQQDLTSQLTIEGEPTEWVVGFDALELGRFYSARIIVAGTETSFTFDTFVPQIIDPDNFDNLLVNGDFEDLSDPFPAAWATIGGDWIAVPHPGLTGEGTAALLHDSARPPGGGPRIRQTLEQTRPRWQLEFLYAGAQPADVGGRTINMLIASGGPHINLRTDYEGNLQAFDGSQFQTILPNFMEFSVDTNGDGTFAGTEDILNVHRIRVVGDYRGSPRFDVYATAANGDEFVHVAQGITFFASGTPAGGAGIDRIDIRSWGEPFIVDEIKIFSVPAPIELVEITPAPGDLFHSNEDGIRIRAASAEPISADRISLSVNGQDVTAQLIISGEPSVPLIQYEGLVSGRLYSLTITLENILGIVREEFSFATFSEAASVTIEAEDYNYSAGQFRDDPPPSGIVNGEPVGEGEGYLDLQGTRGVDFWTAREFGGEPAINQYRIFDPVGTRVTADTLRSKYIEATVPDYEVWQIQPGDWLNYTRTFPANRYFAFLRASSSAAQTVELSHVADATVADQTSSLLGVFQVPNTEGRYELIPLHNDGSAMAALDLDGIQTLRLTAPDANNNLLFNYLLIVPAPDIVQQVTIFDPLWQDDSFHFSFATEAGRNYTVEYTITLSPPQWNTLSSVEGDGSVNTITDTAPADLVRLYRIRINP